MVTYCLLYTSIDLALTAQQMGLNIFIVLEMPSELDVIMERARRMDIRPNLGPFLHICTQRIIIFELLPAFLQSHLKFFFYNGGNDSMDTCNKISKFMQQSGYECRVIGIPKTIDNDLHGTDHCLSLIHI